MKVRRKRVRDRAAVAPAPPPPAPPPPGHATDQELFDLECGEPSDVPPVSLTYIAARRRIYDLGRAHGWRDAELALRTDERGG